MICYIGLGSNLGDRQKKIKLAVKMIGRLKGTRLIRKSAIIETRPVGGPAGQPDFLNAAVKIDTALSARSLLAGLKDIEKQLGRKKRRRFGPREIDLDILLYSDKVIKNKILTVPHPRMFKRDFVIKPLEQVI
jgi:2-amino-4-hydroxy-6-hydroxymethyldihydropteridine diphosphokinase